MGQEKKGERWSVGVGIRQVGRRNTGNAEVRNAEVRPWGEKTE